MVYTALICSSAIIKYGKETNSLLTTKQGQKQVPLTMIEIVTSNQRLSSHSATGETMDHGMVLDPGFLLFLDLLNSVQFILCLLFIIGFFLHFSLVVSPST